jgi:hypothetical protein
MSRRARRRLRRLVRRLLAGLGRLTALHRSGLDSEVLAC